MTRTEFVKDFAERNELSPEFAELGFVDVGDRTVIAMPCACGDGDCLGWAMMTADGVDHHLLFNAPEALRRAYREATEEREQSPLTVGERLQRAYQEIEALKREFDATSSARMEAHFAASCPHCGFRHPPDGMCV